MSTAMGKKQSNNPIVVVVVRWNNKTSIIRRRRDERYRVRLPTSHVIQLRAFLDHWELAAYKHNDDDDTVRSEGIEFARYFVHIAPHHSAQKKKKRRWEKDSFLLFKFCLQLRFSFYGLEEKTLNGKSSNRTARRDAKVPTRCRKLVLRHAETYRTCVDKHPRRGNLFPPDLLYLGRKTSSIT